VIHVELRGRNILVVTPDGRLERADFEELERRIDPLIGSNGKLAGLMIHAHAFPGWQSLEAFVSHARFVADHHRRIERIAVVTDSGFLKILPRIAGLFVQAKIRPFDYWERDQALAWLETGRAEVRPSAP
jgi:stage II sporulation SpoAA-like protein